MIDFTKSAPALAEDLIGCGMFMSNKQGKCGGIITETEAYTADDPASHSFRGKTIRNSPMFMKPGTIYIYSIYGLHKCFNIVCGKKDGQAVLIRALQPTSGVEIMKKRRGLTSIAKLCNGPAKLYSALEIPPELNGTSILNSPIQLTYKDRSYKIAKSKRIGITKATETLWRFTLR